MKFKIELTEREMMSLEMLSGKKLKTYSKESSYAKEEFSVETKTFVGNISEEFVVDLYMLIAKMMPAIKQFAKGVKTMVLALASLFKDFIKDTEDQIKPFLEKWEIGKKHRKIDPSKEEADFVYYLEKYENIVDISSKEATESVIKELEYLYSKLSEEEKSFYRKPFLKTLSKLERIKRRFY